MKRATLHILFWAVYLIQDAFLHYAWMNSILKDVPEKTQVWMAIQTATIVLPPKLFIVYYFIVFGVKKLLADKKNWPVLILEMGFCLAVSIALFRISFHYIINPHVYSIPVNVALFNARNVLISILEIGYITGIGVTLKLLRQQISSTKREQEANEREQILLKEKLQTELKFLKNQTNPHFLFNTLSNIYGLARKKSDKTAEVVMKLSELLSFMLYESKRETVSISDELKMIDDYISLEKIRYSERLTVDLTKEIDNSNQSIAPLLLLPLVENAFKHGVSQTRFDSFVNINVKLTDNLLQFCIENSVECDKVKLANGNIGLSSIKRQLELMYSEQELKITNQEKIFKVELKVNLSSYGKV